MNQTNELSTRKNRGYRPNHQFWLKWEQWQSSTGIDLKCEFDCENWRKVEEIANNYLVKEADKGHHHFTERKEDYYVGGDIFRKLKRFKDQQHASYENLQELSHLDESPMRIILFLIGIKEKNSFREYCLGKLDNELTENRDQNKLPISAMSQPNHSFLSSKFRLNEYFKDIWYSISHISNDGTLPVYKWEFTFDNNFNGTVIRSRYRQNTSYSHFEGVVHCLHNHISGIIYNASEARVKTFNGLLNLSKKGKQKIFLFSSETYHNKEYAIREILMNYPPSTFEEKEGHYLTFEDFINLDSKILKTSDKYFLSNREKSVLEFPSKQTLETLYETKKVEWIAGKYYVFAGHPYDHESIIICHLHIDTLMNATLDMRHRKYSEFAKSGSEYQFTGSIVFQRLNIKGILEDKDDEREIVFYMHLGALASEIFSPKYGKCIATDINGIPQFFDVLIVKKQVIAKLLSKERDILDKYFAIPCEAAFDGPEIQLVDQHLRKVFPRCQGIVGVKEKAIVNIDSNN